MYSLFEISGTPAARIAAAVTGSMIITAVMLASTLVPASPASATLAIGALA